MSNPVRQSAFDLLEKLSNIMNDTSSDLSSSPKFATAIRRWRLRVLERLGGDPSDQQWNDRLYNAIDSVRQYLKTRDTRD